MTDGPTYGDVLNWYGDLAACVVSTIVDLDWEPLLGSREPEVTSRTKTYGTLREKLLRLPQHQLQTLQDVAGVRFEAEMSLSEQDAVVSAIAGAFAHGIDAVSDLRAVPHSGYRAVHVRLVFPAGRVEVQVRTHIQGRWANAYEACGDYAGRMVRYGELPEDPDKREIVEQLQRSSTVDGAELEDLRDQTQRLRLRNPADRELADFEDQVRHLERRFTGTMEEWERWLRSRPLE